MTTSASPTLNLEPGTLNPRWSPSPDDHLIYRWCKFEGYTQSHVAQMLRISQPTVCRIIQRYERWQAHLKDREGGRLDARERLRAQRWLTYERNELIITSCLRIADEMERSTELSKTTIRRPIDEMQPRQLCTEQRVVDRHGVASRFLRLLFRVNMEQLRLTELLAGSRSRLPGGTSDTGQDDDLPEPLTDEELAAELRQAALDAAELAAARHAADTATCQDGATERGSDGEIQTNDLSVPPSLSPSVPPSAPVLNPEPRTLNPHPMNNLNNACVLEITTTPNAPCTCQLQTGAEKNSAHTCIINCDQPAWPPEIPTRSVSEGPGSETTSLHRELNPANA